MGNFFGGLLGRGSIAGVRSIMLMLALSFTGAAAAQAPLDLDVPFVPTRTEVVSRMLTMAQVGPSDFLIDLGSGDGRIPVTAVRDFGAKGAFGVDIDPDRVDEARASAQQEGVSDKVRFEVQDLFQTDLSRASVISMYLLPDVNLKLRPAILDLAPGTRIVSHDFDMDDWESDAHADVGRSRVYFWVVPAKVDGKWLLSGPDGDVMLNLAQSFQKFNGRAIRQGAAAELIIGRLRGSELRFDIGEGAQARRYVGRVQGDSIVAVAAPGAVQGWQAERR
ncbi:class I SAM-dependent methyltransferase [Pollutimonas sp. H1-120]|uniref:SAM-dependent methyltransferase n=1 Tax=Pollutimonas sp. H1-120 TaxID=3148824 RepID=UPI003B52C2B6